MALLRRGVGVLHALAARKRTDPLRFRSFLFSSSSSSPSSLAVPGTDVVAAGYDLLIDGSPEAGAAVSATAAIGSSLLQPGVVVYDGVCHLCHKGVKWVIRADKYRKIKFCCLQSKVAEPYMRLCGVDREDVRRRFLFIEGPGLYHQGSTAALKVLSHLPLPYSALSALLIVPKPLREPVYDFIAKHRYDWFGKEDDCLVLQEKELLERFVDREELMHRN
ncbi:uncharacterized protein LOC127796317 [Diospyros lotus]|uniref:uncharacterized protein LOC127796317 n=1 Tax=Diospyros lotus TaxID=55363 RepID=UPI0022573A42|nr:uncharacterized protein LOC127796317 [Diospyros lotus]